MFKQVSFALQMLGKLLSPDLWSWNYYVLYQRSALPTGSIFKTLASPVAFTQHFDIPLPGWLKICINICHSKSSLTSSPIGRFLLWKDIALYILFQFSFSDEKSFPVLIHYNLANWAWEQTEQSQSTEKLGLKHKHTCMHTDSVTFSA